MKINNIFSYFLIFAVFFFFACEKETELEIPRPKQKLVVNSILRANEAIDVYVGKSNFVLDANLIYITDAQVIITNNNNQDTIPFAGNGFYSTETVICKENNTYSIEIITKEFEKAIATTHVPATAKFSNYSLNHDAGIGREGFRNKVLTVSIPDNSETRNYYMLMLEWHSLDTIPVQGFVHNNEWYSYSPIIIAEGDEDEYVFSDILFNGKLAEIPMNFHLVDYEIHYDLRYCMKCYLITISEDYYKYHKSYMLLQESEDNIWQMNSPPQLYSNIDNAFGIFSALNISDSIIINF